MATSGYKRDDVSNVDYNREFRGDPRSLYSQNINNHYNNDHFVNSKSGIGGDDNDNYYQTQDNNGLSQLQYHQVMQTNQVPSGQYQNPPNSQERFHPTTYNDDANEHTGEVVLSADNTNSQDNFLQDNSAVSSSFGSDLAAQGSDSGGSQVDLQPPANSAGEQNYEYTAPALPSGYDYHPPPLVTSYYYPPPVPPSIQYLPTPTLPPPPPPPPLPIKSTHYYLGAKLWFLPLLFSAYYIIYVTLLIFRDLFRHKTTLSQHLLSAATSVRSARDDGSLLDQLTRSVTKQLVNASVKYLKRSKN